MRLLISGYGGKSGDTAGVYDLNEKRFIWRSGIASISYMCSGEDGAFFGAGEHEDNGFVYMFIPDNGTYKMAGKIPIDGKALCHIAYSSKHKILTGACYGSGDVFSIEVKQYGFGEMKSYVRQGGAEAELTRSHCVVFSKNEDELYSANIALDRIYRYEIEDGKLRESGYRQLVKGVGPRHILNVSGRYYVITEYSNEIINISNGNSRISALPDGFSGESYCSTLCFLPVNEDFGYLYAANRGADTVAVFKHNNIDGTIEKVHDCSCGGKCPRHMALINMDGAIVLAAANQHTGEVVFFEINKDGSLGRERIKIPFEGASYVGEGI